MNFSVCRGLFALSPLRSGDVMVSCLHNSCFVLKSIKMPQWSELVVNMNGSYVDVWIHESSDEEHKA